MRRAMADSPGFSSAQEIHARLREQGGAIGLSTVYRHLQSLVDQGLADAIHSADGEATYRLCGVTAGRKGHHHHLVCRSCGRAEEIEGRALERWLATTAEKYGYTDVDHTVEVSGICAACAG